MDLEIFKEIFLSVLFPQTCYVCDELSTEPVCKKCLSDFLQKYRKNLIRREKNTGIYLKAPFVYQDVVEEMIKDFKYHGIFFSVNFFIPYIAQLVAEDEPFDYLLPVPLHFFRKLKRGFNQSEIIAKKISEKLNIPIFKGIYRKKHTKPQAKLNAEERVKNIKDAFELKQTYHLKVRGKSFAIIDDVITTGATTGEIAKILLRYGAEKIIAYSIAITEY